MCFCCLLETREEIWDEVGPTAVWGAPLLLSRGLVGLPGTHLFTSMPMRLGPLMCARVWRKAVRGPGVQWGCRRCPEQTHTASRGTLYPAAPVSPFWSHLEDPPPPFYDVFSPLNALQWPPRQPCWGSLGHFHKSKWLKCGPRPGMRETPGLPGTRRGPATFVHIEWSQPPSWPWTRRHCVCVRECWGFVCVCFCFCSVLFV